MHMLPIRLALSIILILMLSGCITHSESRSVHAPNASVGSEAWGGESQQAEHQSYSIAEMPTSNRPSNAVSVEPAASKDARLEHITDTAKAQQDDIWTRLRAGFEMPNSKGRTEVKRWIKWYQKHPRHLELLFDRSRYYLKYVVDQVEQRHMPMEVALLPAVESAFDPFAYSHGQAAGMWQFVPMTADRFNLRRDWWYDGRRDVPQSTTAALDYLSYLARLFDGDWGLAMAAYNAGEGTVGRAIKKNKKARRGVSFWQLNLPRETTSYVPKLVALAEIIRHPEHYGIRLPALPNSDVFVPVEIPGQIDLAQAADMAKVSLSLIQKLNPGHNRWATAPDGPHRLLLPTYATERFQRALAAKNGKGLVTWKRHKIRGGDSLIALASHFETSVEMIREVNQIDGSNIRAGQYLLIPVSTRGLGDYALSSNARRQATLSAAKKSSNSTVHQVEKGDSYWSIARKYGVSVNKLLRWNKLSAKDYVRPGQKLIVRGATHAVPKQVKKIHYTVRSGDSLDYISRKFRVSIGQLCDWNQIKLTSYLQPGQRLRVFVNPTELSS